jgi:hypothetical protein
MSASQESHGIFLNGNLGIKVPRASAADVAGWVTIYNIVGGYVLVTGLYGFVTTLHAGALCNIAFRHGTGGTALSQLVLAAALPVGSIVSITGDPLDNTLVSVGTGVANTAPPLFGVSCKGSAVGGTQEMGILCGVGTIQVDWTVVTAGATRYILTYIPVDDQAKVFPA